MYNIGADALKTADPILIRHLYKPSLENLLSNKKEIDRQTCSTKAVYPLVCNISTLNYSDASKYDF